MRIGFNVKKIYENVMLYVENIMNQAFDIIDIHETRITTLENNTTSEWIEITSSNGQEAEITQPFTEIRMLAKVGSNGNCYVVTCNYDDEIFHNITGGNNKYFIVGNPTQNNYGCKFKYMVNSRGKQYVCVDSCFDGGNYDSSEFRAWIKPAPTDPQ